MTGFAVRPLVEADCAAVAELHLCHLPTSFHGAAGRRLLACYYEAVAQGQDACGYVIWNEDRLAGYACGVWDAEALRSGLLRRRGGEVALWGVLHAATQPRMLADLRRRLVRGAGEDGAEEPGYELRPIVVAPEYRGTGAATALVESIVADARRRRYPQVHLLAYASDDRALRFYRKAGFHEAAQIERGGARFIRFVRETAEPQ